MQHSETYKGVEIAVVTTRGSQGEWTSFARFSFPGHDEIRVDAEGPPYASEEEASQAALQTAIENIDRMRITKGKP
jgi:hypothetical protein